MSGCVDGMDECGSVVVVLTDVPIVFQETKRPSKEMQVTIARQLGLEPSTVGNFFMNARRRSMDKWKDDNEGGSTKMCGGMAPGGTTMVHMAQVQQMGGAQTNTMVGHCLEEHDL